VPGVQPLLMNEEYVLAQGLVGKDERFLQALRKRGLKDTKGVALEPWAEGHVRPSDGPRRRLLRVMAFYQGDSQNRYARPIEGLLATVDVGEGKVVEVTDTGALPVPPESGDYDAKKVGPLRPP